jgi:hypothetical protein
MRVQHLLECSQTSGDIWQTASAPYLALKMLRKSWRSMTVEASPYSFRFVFFLERIPLHPVRGLWRFSRFAVGHCPGAAQSGPIHHSLFTIHYSPFTIHHSPSTIHCVSPYSFRFVFLERIPIHPVRGLRRFSRFAVGHCPGATQSGTIHHSLITIHHSLFTIHYSPFTQTPFEFLPGIVYDRATIQPHYHRGPSQPHITSEVPNGFASQHT